MTVIALPDLANIPRVIMMWERNLLREIEVIVHSWIEEPIQPITEEDTTPPATVFDEVRRTNMLALSGMAVDSGGREVITIEYDTLLAVWAAMPEGPDKNRIEESLKMSPHYLSREYERRNRVLATGSGKGALIQPGELTPVQPTVGLESQKEGSTGEEAARAILASINCNLERGEHSQGTDLKSHPSQALVGLTPTQRMSWADMEDEFELGLQTQPGNFLTGPSFSDIGEILQPASMANEDTGLDLEVDPQVDQALDPIVHINTSDPPVQEVESEPEEVIQEIEETPAQPEAAVELQVAQPVQPEELLVQPAVQPVLEPMPAQPAVQTELEVNQVPVVQAADNQVPVVNQVLAPPGPTTNSTVRRSVRILERGSASKVYIKKRAPRKANKRDKAKEEEAKKVELAIIAALQDEALASKPLTDEEVAQIENYCGSLLMPPIPTTEEEAEGIGAAGEDNEEESVLAGIDYDSDEEFMQDDEEGGSAST